MRFSCKPRVPLTVNGELTFKPTQSDSGAHFLNNSTAFIIYQHCWFHTILHIFPFLDRLILFQNRSLCAQSGLQTFTSCPPSWNAFLKSHFSWLQMTQCSMWPLHQLISSDYYHGRTQGPQILSQHWFFSSQYNMLLPVTSHHLWICVVWQLQYPIVGSGHYPHLL